MSLMNPGFKLYGFMCDYVLVYLRPQLKYLNPTVDDINQSLPVIRNLP